MKVSVIIPTLNAEAWLDRLLDRLIRQTVAAEILVIDSESDDATCRIAASHAPRVRLLHVPRERFNHGGTRDFALRQSTGEYVLFLTQDALPADRYYIEKLLSAFSSPDVAAVCGRQIAWPDAPEYEKLNRQFNYPDQPRIWREADIPRYGVKSYFFSNACAAYRRETYLAVGGFDAPIISNEDMMMAAKLLHAGYALAYSPDAAVYHSHRYTFREELRRNIRIGKVMEQYRDRLTGADSDTEGWSLLRYVNSGLLRQKRYGEVFSFCMRAAVRFTGNRIGKLSGKGDHP